MKKLMIAVAAMTAGMCFADVSSANCVGYTSATCEKGKWYLCAAQFEKVGGESATLNDLISGDMVSNYDASQAPNIKIYKADGSGYNDFYYLSMAMSADGSQFFYDVWASGDLKIADNTIAPGNAIWYRDNAEVSHITFAGQVVEASETPKALKQKVYNLIANPYPVAIDPNNDVKWEGIVSDYDASSAPNAKIYKADGSGYDDFYYLSMAMSADGSQFFYNVWASGDLKIMTKRIPVGQAFWVKPTTDVTATFSLK